MRFQILSSSRDTSQQLSSSLTMAGRKRKTKATNRRTRHNETPTLFCNWRPRLYKLLLPWKRKKKKKKVNQNQLACWPVFGFFSPSVECIALISRRSKESLKGSNTCRCEVPTTLLRNSQPNGQFVVVHSAPLLPFQMNRAQFPSAAFFSSFSFSSFFSINRFKFTTWVVKLSGFFVCVCIIII